MANDNGWSDIPQFHVTLAQKCHWTSACIYDSYDLNIYDFLHIHISSFRGMRVAVAIAGRFSTFSPSIKENRDKD